MFSLIDIGQDSDFIFHLSLPPPPMRGKGLNFSLVLQSPVVLVTSSNPYLPSSLIEVISLALTFPKEVLVHLCRFKVMFINFFSCFILINSPSE